jgi:hypothetical protein
MNIRAPSGHIPVLVTYAFTAFVVVLVPFYWRSYGPTNFLYFCDVSLFLTLFAVWRRHALSASMATVGILIPQVFWCVDFACELLGVPLSGMTAYMFNQNNPAFLRGLSLFHGWLPFLLLFLTWRLGYDRRALRAWTILAWSLCVLAFFFLPPAGAVLPDPNIPRNVNYVFGTNDAVPQTYMEPHLYLMCYMIGLFAVFFVPTHFVLRKFFPAYK